MRIAPLALPALLALATPAGAYAQDLLQHHADGHLVRGASVCVGPLSPSDPGGVQIVGSTPGPAALAWEVWSTSSQTAPVRVFSRIGTGVDAVVPPSGNMLFYACVTRGPATMQDYELDLKSAVTGDPPAPEAIQQEHAFGTIGRGVSACGGPLAPSGADGVQIFGYTNGVADLTWQVFSVDDAGARTLAFTRRGTFVDRTIPPVDGLEYVACVSRGPAVREDFDLSLNSTTLE